MRGDIYIKFRDQEDVLVEYDIDMSGPGSGCTVEWWFAEMTAEQNNALNITAEEEEAIIERCIAAAEDRDRGGHEGDAIPRIEREPGEKIGTPLSELSGQPGTPGYEKFKRIAKSWGYD